MNKRIDYIDNLRWMTVSLLIIFHAAVAYNTWGESNYIYFKRVKSIASIVTFIDPWFMPLMFLLAGASSFYSLKKRGYSAFMRERFLRLGIPLLFGLLVLNPVLSYIADLTHNGFSGGFFMHYRIYFSRFTDLTGYDGGFTLGHLWFVFILLIISLISCVIIRLAESIPEKKRKTVVNITGVLLSVAATATFDIKYFGKPLIMFLCVYLLGYFHFSTRNFVTRLAKFKWIYVMLFLAVSIADVVLYIYAEGFKHLNTVCYYASFVLGIIALVSLAHDYLDFSNRFTVFNTKISYVFYIIHFPAVILCQYVLSLTHMNCIANFILTVLITYPLTYGLCFVIEKTKVIRVLFGLKAVNKREE